MVTGSTNLTAASTANLPFLATATVATGTNWATSTTLVPDAQVPAGKSVYIAGYRAVVSGSTAWSGSTTTVSVSTSGTSSVVTFMTIPVDSLTGTAALHSSAANSGALNPFLL